MTKRATIAAVCFVALSHCGTSSQSKIDGSGCHVEVHTTPLFIVGCMVGIALLASFFRRRPIRKPPLLEWPSWKRVAGAHLADLIVLTTVANFPATLLELSVEAARTGRWSWDFMRTECVPSDTYVIGVGLLGFPIVSLLWGSFWRTSRQSPGAYLAGIRPEIGEHSVLRLALLGWLEGVSFCWPWRTGPGELFVLDYRVIPEPGDERSTPTASRD